MRSGNVGTASESLPAVLLVSLQFNYSLSAMLAQSQQLAALEPRNKQSLEFSVQKPPRHPQLENQIEQHRTQKPILQKRYKNAVDEAEAKQSGKVSLPSLPNIRKIDLQDDKAKNQMQMVNYGNGLRIPSRLPKLDARSEIPRQKYSSHGLQNRQSEENLPHYSSVTPERKQQSPERQRSLNMKYLMAKSCSLGQYAVKTKPGCMPNKQAKTNQDAAIVFPANLEQIGYQLIAVSDGHGVNGHKVSNLIKNNLPRHLEMALLKEASVNSALLRAFDRTNRDIWDSDIDTDLSGSTTVSLLIRKEQLWTANVGDSRAIICRNKDGWKAIPITRDHKPTEEDEKQRILDAGGRVELHRDYYGNPAGPERVWLQHEDKPGLAMTRSLGDKIGAQAGVIAEPEILEFSLTPYDQCLIVASDGVWEYLSNEEVMNIVVPYIEKENVDKAADKLMAESISAWRRNQSRDDITFIIVNLKP